MREVEVEDDEGRLEVAPVRFGAVSSTQLAQQHAEADSQAQVREAEAVAEHGAQVQRRRCACEAEAEAASAEDAGRGRGQRGRPPCRWRSHAVRYRVEGQGQRTPRRQRGRPRQGEAGEHELGSRLHVTTKVLSPPVAMVGWLVLATTVSEHPGNDAEIIRAYRAQTTTVAPGFRWIKNPAAIRPGWWEKRERIAALAMRTVVGLLVYGVIQRQVRQYVHQRHESMPGNKGETAPPTATVVFASCASVTLVSLALDGTLVSAVHGWQAHHRLICQALGLSDSWYEDVANRKNNSMRRRAP